MPEGFTEGGGSVAMADRFWESFGDPTLDGLVKEALQSNPDLLATWSRLAQANAGVKRDNAGRIPSLSASASASGSVRSDGETTSRSTATGLGLAASYEVDLWGSLSASREIAALSALTSAANLRASAISLSSEIANTWFDLIVARQTLILLDAQRKDALETQRLVSLRFEIGTVPETDDLRQRQQVESLTGDLELGSAQVALLENRLALLLGHTPGYAIPQSTVLPDVPGLPQTGVPLDVIARRPEVEASYLAIESADRQVAVAMAAKLPSLRLNANLSTAGSLTSLFSGAVASLVAGLAAPLIDGGRIDAEISIAKEVVIEKAHSYRGAVLTALQEVEDALIRESRQTAFIASLERELALASAAREKITAAYAAGTVDQLEVLSSTDSVRSLERALLSARRDQLSFRVALYRSLAGGWEMARPAENAEAGV